jgi:hypothetical protein
MNLYAIHKESLFMNGFISTLARMLIASQYIYIYIEGYTVGEASTNRTSVVYSIA